MIKKTLITASLTLSLLIPLLGAGCASDQSVTSSATTSMKTYTNTTKGFSVEYPDTWTVRETGLTTADVIINAPAINDFSPNITIAAKTFPADPRWDTLDKLKAYLIEGEQKTIKDFKLISSDNITLAGQPGFKIESTSSDPDSNIKGHSVEYWVKKGDTTYLLEVLRSQDKPTAYDTEFNALVNSFKITK